MTDKMVFNDDEFHITFNGRDVEMKVSAIAWYSHSKQTDWEPAFEDFEIEEIIIQNAHYTDDGSLIDPEIIDPAVQAELESMDGERWRNYSEEERTEKIEYEEYCKWEIAEAKLKGEL